MKTLERFAAGLDSIPTPVAWYLEEIAESRGRQELYLRQSPQVLQALREHALIESAISSNRIEGVEVEQSRVAALVFGQAALRDRNEEEVRGYRDALNLIHTKAAALPREMHPGLRVQGASATVSRFRSVSRRSLIPTEAGPLAVNGLRVPPAVKLDKQIGHRQYGAPPVKLPGEIRDYPDQGIIENTIRYRIRKYDLNDGRIAPLGG